MPCFHIPLSHLPIEPDISVVFFLNSVGEYEAIEDSPSSEVLKALVYAL